MRPVYLLGEQLLVFIALLAFMLGFITLQPPEVDKSKYEIPTPPDVIKKVVIMVIDGLRSDHMLMMEKNLDTGAPVTLRFMDNMTYLSEQLRSTQSYSMKHINAKSSHLKIGNPKGDALGFEVITSSPTVTLPRLMSLVSGIIPGFLTVATNFRAARITEDNIIQRWKQKGLRMDFYGDDTWIKMFPDSFNNVDPVTSFFVSDISEVDHNVSRHLDFFLDVKPDENPVRKLGSSLFNATFNSWDVTVLHFLGLDHAGHTFGSTHSSIQYKLDAMDQCIQRIHKTFKQQNDPYLILVTGDHGMADGGGHGGSSYYEIRTSAAFITSEPLYRSVKENYLIRQVDIASTLAAVTGVAVPVSSIGVPVLQVVRGVLDQVSLYRLYKSEAHRLVDLLKAAALPYGDAGALLSEAEWIEAQNIDMLSSVGVGLLDHKNNTVESPQHTNQQQLSAKIEQLLSLYVLTCSKASELLVKKMQMYDLPVLVPSALIIALIAFTRVVSTCTMSLHRHHTLSSSSAKRSSILYSMCVSCCIALILWALSCGVSGSSRSQLCKPVASPVVWYLLLPTVYAFQITTIIFTGLYSSLRAGVTSAYHKLRYLVLPHASLYSWCSEGGLLRDFTIIGTVCQVVSLVGTSFVEEEHQSFYFLHTSFIVCLLLMTAALLVKVFCSEDSKRSSVIHSSCSISDYDSSNLFEANLVKRNTELRQNMRHAYEQFGLTTGMTGTSESIDAADSKLADTLSNRSETNASKNNNYRIVLTFLSLLVSLSLFRLTRAWNATGDKWRHIPDLEDTIRRMEPMVRHMLVGVGIIVSGVVVNTTPLFMWLTLVFIFLRHVPLTDSLHHHHQDNGLESMISYMFIFLILYYSCWVNFLTRYGLYRARHRPNKFTCTILAAVGVIPFVLIQKHLPKKNSGILPSSSRDSGPVLPKANLEALINIYNSRHKLIAQMLSYITAAIMLLWLVLQRKDNILLGALMLAQCRIIIKSLSVLVENGVKSVAGREADGSARTVLALGVMWMAQAFFFCQGNSNNLASIDVSRGFVGISSYHSWIHGTLIYLYTMGGPLIVYLVYIKELLTNVKTCNGKENLVNRSVWSRLHGSGWWEAIRPTLTVWWTVRLSSVGLYAVTLVLQRNHLFIWSVFTPKMIYEIAHLFNLFIVNILLVLLAALCS